MQARLLGDGIRSLAGEHSVDVIVVDCGVQPKVRRERIAAVAAAFPGARIVALVEKPTRLEFLELFETGVRAVVARDSAPAQLREAVAVARSGLFTFCPLTALHVTTPSDAERAHTAERAPLSTRELEVVRHLCWGRSNSEIGEAICIAESTVKSHLANVMSKWAARDRLEVALHAVRSGLAGVD